MGGSGKLYFLLGVLHVCYASSADQKIITADSGDNVNLTCQASNNNIFIVEWSRADLGDEHVAVFKDKELKEDDQHPLFKNRVDLQDKEMKDGDVSVILKNVTINDAGTYECCIVMRETVSCDPICTIDLRVVDPPGQTGGDTGDGSVGLIIGLVIFAVLLAAVVGVLIYKKCNPLMQGSSQPPVELQSV